ncbi:MAG: ABC transporter ATP-binding protein [Sarcina sp.]
MNSVISIDRLNKNYNGSRGITDVSFAIKRGEIVGFIGPNGAGKSTTIKILLNMIFKDSGEAKILGLDCELESKKIKEKVGYVPSEVRFYENVKVKDIIEYVVSFYENIDRERVEYICEKLEIDKTKRMKELSLGNKKKIAILQALIGSPEIIILDEPTNGLDPLVQKNLFEIILEENRKGKTIFLSSHNLTEVQSYCDKAIIIKEGKIIDIKDMSDLKGIKKKKITIVSDEVKEKDLREFSDKINVQENKLEFNYSGDINKLLLKLVNYKILDLNICEEELLDSFMHYYEGGE